MTDNTDEFAQDLLRGADEIAIFLFGDSEKRRQVYHLISTSQFPSFKLGSMLCARRSVVLDWVAKQESRHQAHKIYDGAPSVKSEKV